MDSKPTDLKLGAIEDSLVTSCTKGMPGGPPPIRLKDIGKQGWNLLREDLPLPLAVLKRSAIDHNIEWMRRFLALTGTIICPHGKTTMSPQLFDLQLQAGAWGITAATIGHVQVYREHGVQRILLANQLVGKSNIGFVLEELRSDPDFDFYCLVDSLEGAELLRQAAAKAGIGRPLQVLIELSRPGGRAGVRSVAEGVALAAAIRDAGPCLALRGIEAFEGAVEVSDMPDTMARIDDLVGKMCALANECGRLELFAEGPVLLTAGGSQFFDIPAQVLTKVRLPQEILVVLRSGCYVAHDSGMYRDYARLLRERMPEVESLGERLLPALEVWAYVQSCPEPGLVIASIGKRDCSFDYELPTATGWFRPGEAGGPQSFETPHNVTMLNDQHAYLEVPADSPLRVGDMIRFGISHPCTTFDKWQMLMLIDDDYDVVGGIRTFF